MMVHILFFQKQINHSCVSSAFLALFENWCVRPPSLLVSDIHDDVPVYRPKGCHFVPAAKTKTTEQLEAIEKYLSKANTKQIVLHHHRSPVISSLVQILFQFFFFFYRLMVLVLDPDSSQLPEGYCICNI